MEEFAAELEQVFGAVPSQDTGLEVDTFDGGGGHCGRAVTACRLPVRSRLSNVHSSR